MPVLTVRAQDSAAAMDEVIRRLGPDALILSTRNRDGAVEIVASDTLPAPMPAPAPVPAPPPVVAGTAAPSSPSLDLGPSPEAAPGWAAGFAAHLARAVGLPSAADPVATDLPRFDGATVLAAPRVVLVGPLGAGKSALALQLAAARLEQDEASGKDPAPPGFAFCGSGSHSDGGYLSQKAWLLGAELVFAAPEALAVPVPGAAQLVVLSDLHPDPPVAARALCAMPGAICLLVLPAGLRAERLAALARRWQGLAQGCVLSLAPGEAASPEDAAPLAAAGIVPLWSSLRGRMIGGLTAPATAPAGPAPTGFAPLKP